ncbi:hypothetical protein AAFG13_38300 [Bradyrhizobium sp. B124]|uniref:hypothetical protein n=1 Tax=Bradyrhizobium sp. B124 TaxID=3140245 RepID=UPI0031838003
MRLARKVVCSALLTAGLYVTGGEHFAGTSADTAVIAHFARRSKGDGNAVSVTYTLNDRFGAKVTATKTGGLLNELSWSPGSRLVAPPSQEASETHR